VRWLFAAVLAATFATATASDAAAQQPPPPAPRVPSFFDANVRIEKPNLSTIRVIRFATADGYPPFHYADPEGKPAGFVVDVARAVCVELGVQCTMRAWRWDLLLDTIGNDQADAIIAMIRPTDALWDRFIRSDRFYQPAARFVATITGPTDPTPEALAGKRIGVLAQTTHEQYAQRFYANAEIKSFIRAEDARAALKAGQVDVLFGDGAALALWLNGTSSEKCCRFVGDAFVDAAYFGEGVGVLTAKDNELLAQAISYALRQMDQKRVFAEIYLRHFPLGYY
jgi:polar amino acid transport system substrate-binding protein